MPNARMPIITSAVMTGRRTNSAAMFIADSGAAIDRSRLGVLRFRDGRSRRKTQLSDRHDAFPRFEPARQHGVVAFGPCDLHVAHFDGIVIADDEDVGTVRSVLYCCGRR